MKKTIGIGAAVFAIIIACAPAVSADAAREALALCGGTLIPSLFPFFVCANVLVGSGMTGTLGRILEKPMRRCFGIGGEGASAVLLGLISGYPAGAAVTCRLYAAGSISRSEAERLLAFTNNAGPLFVIGVIGMGVYQSAEVGYMLLIAQSLAAISVGACMRLLGKRTGEQRGKVRRCFGDPMGDAVQTLLTLCGFVIFFSVLTAFMETAGILEAIRRILCLAGMGENTAALLTEGFFEITAAAKSKGAAMPAMAGLLSFGGMSVFLQTVSLVRKAGLSMKSYCLGKGLAVGFSALYCRFLLSVWKPSMEVSLSAPMAKTVLFGGYLGAAALLAIFVYGLHALLERFFK